MSVWNDWVKANTTQSSEEEGVSDDIKNLQAVLEEYGSFDDFSKSMKERSRTICSLKRENERLKKELAELPKKICDEIKNSAAYLSSGFFGTWLKIDLDTLDEIEEKYTKGEN